MESFDFTEIAENGSDFSSDAVDVLAYNENTRQLAVEWGDSWRNYRYDNVSPEEYKALFTGSVGHNVSVNIKQVKGPGAEVELGEEVPVSSTKEFSLQTPAAPANTPPVTDAGATKEFSLQTPAAPEKAKTGGLSLVDGDVVFTLHFTVNDDSTERTHVLRGKDNFDEAVETLSEFAESFGHDLKIFKVVATFE